MRTAGIRTTLLWSLTSAFRVDTGAGVETPGEVAFATPSGEGCQGYGRGVRPGYRPPIESADQRLARPRAGISRTHHGHTRDDRRSPRPTPRRTQRLTTRGLSPSAAKSPAAVEPVTASDVMDVRNRVAMMPEENSLSPARSATSWMRACYRVSCQRRCGPATGTATRAVAVANSSARRKSRSLPPWTPATCCGFTSAAWGVAGRAAAPRFREQLIPAGRYAEHAPKVTSISPSRSSRSENRESLDAGRRRPSRQIAGAVAGKTWGHPHPLLPMSSPRRVGMLGGKRSTARVSRSRRTAAAHQSPDFAQKMVEREGLRRSTASTSRFPPPACALHTMIGMWRVRSSSLNRRTVSRPSMTGMATSVMMMSGRRATAFFFETLLLAGHRTLLGQVKPSSRSADTYSWRTAAVSSMTSARGRDGIA